MLHELFIKDWLWKLFSLLLAVAIWFTVHRVLLQSAAPVTASDNSRITYGNLPVSAISSTTDVHLYRVVPSEVKVVVTGSQEAIASLSASQIRVTVDLTDFNAVKDLKKDVDVSMPPGITLISVDPPKVGVIPPPAS
jgi:YbbR domain-containing protein